MPTWGKIWFIFASITSFVSFNLRPQFREQVWSFCVGPVDIDDDSCLKQPLPIDLHSIYYKYGIIKHPFGKFQDLLLRNLLNATYNAKREFYVENMDEYEDLVLSISASPFGIVRINSDIVGLIQSEFVVYEFKLKGHLKLGQNWFSIEFPPQPSIAKVYAEKYSRRTNHSVPPQCPPDIQHGICFVNFVRTKPLSYGWDFAPAFPTISINEVSLKYRQTLVPNFLKFHFIYKHFNNGRFLLGVSVPYNFEWTNQVSKLKVFCKVSIEELNVSWIQVVTISVLQPKNFECWNPTRIYLQRNQLWWPRSYGSQRMYNITTVITFNSQNFYFSSKIAIRSVELIQEPVATDGGRTFYFRLNGVPVYLKGANIVPIELFRPWLSKSRIDSYLNSILWANMNTVRVWGGGGYLPEYFYHQADKLGLLILQDFSFACSLYPTDDNFLNNVALEISQKVRLLLSHPSVIAFTGNNENELAIVDDWFETTNETKYYMREYIKLYVDTIKRVKEAEDSYNMTVYIISSPSNGVESEANHYFSKHPQDARFGDVHRYDYESDCWNASSLPVPRLMTEYGYQSYPSLKNILFTGARGSDLHIDSKFLQHLQRHPDGKVQIQKLAQHHFRIPNSQSHNLSHEKIYSYWSYISQVSQAMCMKIMTENLRIHRGSVKNNYSGNMGAIYWQLNDVWPSISWSSIDYLGYYKILHYYAKDMFRDLTLAIQKKESTFKFWCINDDPYQDKSVHLVIEFRSWNKFSPLKTVKVQPNLACKHSSSTLLYEMEHYDSQDQIQFLFTILKDSKAEKRILLSDQSHVISQFHLLSSFHNITLLDSELTICNVTEPVKISNIFSYSLWICSRAPAAFVHLSTDSTVNGTFSQNGFHIIQPVHELMFYSTKYVKRYSLKYAIVFMSMYDLQKF